MTKSDLIEHLSLTEKLPKGRAELLVNTIFECMEASLKRGERIEIRGFGSFEIRNYRAYEGRNPRTGSTVPVRPKRLPFFKVGKELKERVNAGAGKTGSNGANGAGGNNGSNGSGSRGTSAANRNGVSATPAAPAVSTPSAVVPPADTTRSSSG